MLLKTFKNIFLKDKIKFYEDDSIEVVHLELTDKCNASCPQCSRNKLGGPVNHHLPLVEMTLKDFKKIFSREYISNLKRLYMCGNYGDPIVAKDTLEIFKYLRSVNPKIHLAMNTNASARDEKWWSELGKVISLKGNIKFAIDGLEDTHSLYRKGTDYNKIIKNAKAFIESGGEAIWEFIVFKHNEHQVEQARELSKKLGFSKFTVKKTGRFFSNTEMKGNDFQNVYNANEEVIYKIEKPLNREYQNVSLEKEEAIVNKYGSLEKYLDQTKVNCKVMNEKSVYVSSEGLVFPCCWTAGQMYLWYMKPNSTPIAKLLESCGGKESINGKNHNIGKIVNGKFFKEIQKSWSCSGLKNGKLKICSRICGESFDQFRDQYK